MKSLEHFQGISLSRIYDVAIQRKNERAKSFELLHMLESFCKAQIQFPKSDTFNVNHFKMSYISMWNNLFSIAWNRVHVS